MTTRSFHVLYVAPIVVVIVGALISWGVSKDRQSGDANNQPPTVTVNGNNNTTVNGSNNVVLP